MENVDALETLGVVMSKDGTVDINVQERINKCRQAYYSLDNTGMPYPGLPIDIKMYLFTYFIFWNGNYVFVRQINKETWIFSGLPNEAFIRIE